MACGLGPGVCPFSGLVYALLIEGTLPEEYFVAQV